MRYLGAFVVVAALSSVAAVQGQTVRSHSSLRIPTPALDEADDAPAASVRAREASSTGESRVVDAREASMLRAVDQVERSAASNDVRPTLVPLDNSATNSVVRSVSATSMVTPISSSPVGTGVQYYGPSVGSTSTVGGNVAPAGFATQANYGAPISSQTSFSSPSYPTPTVMQTSFSAPTAGACCSPNSVGPVMTGMQPTFASPTFPATTFPTTTVLSPSMTDAASFPPSLVGSTIPGANPSGQMVPYLVNPVAVNVPAVPVDESRLQPVLALRPTVPEESYAGRGILGQPELYVRGQHVRNVLRYITLW